ncbi:MAG: hypothetical protein ABIH87_01865 [bacterium]
MTIQQFIKKRPYLVWYTKNYDELSEDAILEATLNYGDFDDVKKMVKILGMRKAADIFKKKNKQKRNNFKPQVSHYFKLFFKQHA